ncbi:MAG: hypothetical protein QOE53_3061, partial [Pseudonocardiales bacterium]|nr:hypothetical protein [Pseudonocardiales bacterium]
AGNESPVATLEVKIDTLPPLFGVELMMLSGHTYLSPTSPEGIPGTAYYGGVTAGSLKFKVIPTPMGGSPAVSAGFSELTADTVGFSFDSSSITTPAGGPFISNTLSWVAGTTSEPSGTITLFNAAGSSFGSPGVLYDDSTAPTGGSVDATGLTGTGNRYSTSLNLNLALAKGTDSQAGIADGSVPSDTPLRLMRASATLSSAGGVADGACGIYGAYTQVGIDNPAATVSDTVPTDTTCYRYQYRVPDHLDNVATYTSGDIKVQTTAPAALRPTDATITPVSGTSAQSVSGSTAYYNPALSGSFNVDSSAGGPFTGVARMTFPALGGFTGGGAVTTPTSGTIFRNTYSWAANSASASPGVQALSATNNAGNTATNSTAFSVVKDDVAPSGGSVNATGLGGTGGRYSTSTTVSIGFTPGTDTGSGLAATGRKLMRASASLTSGGAADGTCGIFGAYSQVGADDPATPKSDTVPVDRSCYRYQYVVPDKVGNVATYTSLDVKVDAAAPPAPALSFSSFSNASWSGSGTNVFYRPAAATGGFAVTAASADTTSGTTGYGFPTLPAGWSDSSGGAGIRNYSWSPANPTAPSGGQSVTATNNAGGQASTTFTATPDSAAPSGGSVDATGLNGTGGRYSTSTTLNVALAPGTDGGSGLAASGRQLLRASATLTSNGTGDGGCGPFGAYAQVGANDPATPKTDVVPADRTCYRYQYTVPDKVGNVATYTSPDIKVDTAAPPAPALTFSSLSNASWSGSGTAVFYRPGAGSGGFTVNASSSDTTAGITAYGFPAFPAGWTGASGGNGIQNYSWSAANPTAPSGAQNVTATNNAGGQASTSFTATPDSAAPSGGSVDATGLVGTGGRYSTSTTLNVAFAPGTDGGSGLAASGRQLLRASATLTSAGGANGGCGTYGAYAQVGANDLATPKTDVVPADRTCYRYQYTVPDKVGNVATYTSPDIKVDTAAPPAPALSFASLSNSYWSGTGTALFYNPNAATGGFSLSANSSDTTAGIITYAFPTLPAGWSGTSVDLVTQSYSWSPANPTAPSGAQTVSATNNAGTSASASFSATPDGAAPSGGSVDATGLTGTGGRYSTSTTLSIGFAPGTDGGSGLAATGRQLLRASATLTSGGAADGTCGTFGSYTQVGANDPVTPKSDVVPADRTCYRYRYNVPDNVGNVATYTSGDIKVDAATPPAPALTFSALSNSYWSGSGTALFYNPSAATGGFTVNASSADTTSGTASYGFPAFPAGWSSAAGGTGVRNYSWTPANPTAPSGGQVVTATNNAGSQSSSTFTATPDAAAPTGGSVTYANGYTGATTISVAFTPGTDAGSGVAAASGLLQRSTAGLTNGACATFGAFTTVATNPTTPNADTVTAGNCYQYRYLISDNLGTQATYTSASVVKV